jgi:hypothetical protein
MFVRAVCSKAFLHWSPQYLYNRFKLVLYEITHPNYPWLTQQANAFLLNWLKKSNIGFEWGSGRSTIWFARRVKYLISVEHEPFWYERVKEKLTKYNLNNCCLVLATSKKDYIGAIDKFNNDSFDFVLVDGLYRDDCTLKAMDKVKAGGILIIDNINRYVPSNSRSPCSRTTCDGFATYKWKLVFKRLKEWYSLWTSNSVTDTAIFIKPSPQT